MNSIELKDMIENARISKGISQRELAKRSNISRSTLNDIINGKIKKIDVDALKKIAEELDLSLEKLLKVAGYDEFLDFLSTDKFKNKSSKDLKDKIEEYQESENDILRFDNEKVKAIRDASTKLYMTQEHLKIMNDPNSKSLYTVDNAIKDINSAINILEPVKDKYDYNKLPKRK